MSSASCWSPARSRPATPTTKKRPRRAKKISKKFPTESGKVLRLIKHHEPIWPQRDCRSKKETLCFFSIERFFPSSVCQNFRAKIWIRFVLKPVSLFVESAFKEFILFPTRQWLPHINQNIWPNQTGCQLSYPLNPPAWELVHCPDPYP